MMLLFNSLLIFIGLAYPFYYLWQPEFITANQISLLVALAMGLRAALRKDKIWLIVAGVMLLATLGQIDTQVDALKLYPVLINFLLFIVFTSSLVYPPSLIERFARRSEPDLPDEAVLYTRRVTQVWSVFFALNGLMVLGLDVFASDAVWAIYTGVVSYCLMGALFALEVLVRMRVRARIGGPIR